MIQQIAKRCGGRAGERGFTLVELAIVIVIIGVLASFGVPRFRSAVERSKAGEAFAYLASVRAAQERYHARTGTYATDLADLDVSMSLPAFFTLPASPEIAAGACADLELCWQMTLTRGSGSGGYGNYTVAWSEDGFVTVGTESTICASPAIMPVDTTCS